MLLRTITLSNTGNACLDGGGYILALGYERNRGVYQLQLRPTGEWDGLTIRACWHLPDGTSTTTLAVDGCVDVPAAVTALPGTGCITFEGAAEGKTITSADLRYLVGDNSGVEDGTLPEPGTPAWQELVGTVSDSAAQAEEAADRADKAAAAAEGALTAALTDITHTGTAQIQAVTRAGEQAVQEVDAAAQAGVGSVEQAQQTATQAMQTAATAAVQRVEQTGSTQVQAIVAAGAEQIKGIETTAAEKLESITQLAGQAEDSATKAEQAAQRAEDAATAASAIIDDTVITPDKTWSSKGIVDVLCPSIQATGNPVVCYPIEGYPLGVTVNFAPIQEGEGDPSPENVRPIKARESVDVVRCGVNLCPYGTQTFARYYWKSFGYFLPSGTYTFSATVKSDDQDYENCLIYFFDTKNNKGVQTATIGRNIRTSIKVSVPGKFDAIYLYSSIGAIESSGKSATFSDIQLEIGATPSAFAPYTRLATTLTLPAPCYGGTVDAVTGEGQETWKVIELVGTEDWLSWGVDFKTPGITGFYTYFINDYDPKQGSLALCSHILYSPFAWGGQNTGVGFSGSSPLHLILSVKNDLLEDTSSTAAAIDSLKAYLAAQYAAGTPVTVAYIKATPTPITATGGKPIPALAGVNTVLTDGDSLTVTGRADPTHKIQQLRAAVVALGGTI